MKKFKILNYFFFIVPISIRGETQGGEEFNYYMKNLKNIKNISFNNGKFDEVIN